MKDLKKIKNKWKAQFELKIDATKSQIWELISSPSNLELFHPFCKKNNVIKWSSNDSIDEIEYLNGAVFRRKFYNWIEKEGYDLYIGAHGKPKSHVSWRIKKDDLKTLFFLKLVLTMESGRVILFFSNQYIKQKEY